MKNLILLGIAVCIAVFLTGNAYAANVIHVPADYATIQEAINAAHNGDLVLVAPGTYQGERVIYFQAKAITVKSETGPAGTIITEGAVTFENGEGPASILDGFTIIPEDSISSAIRNRRFGFFTYNTQLYCQGW